jgi:hypothetical protein
VVVDFNGVKMNVQAIVDDDGSDGLGMNSALLLWICGSTTNNNNNNNNNNATTYDI